MAGDSSCSAIGWLAKAMRPVVMRASRCPMCIPAPGTFSMKHASTRTALIALGCLVTISAMGLIGAVTVAVLLSSVALQLQQQALRQQVSRAGRWMQRDDGSPRSQAQQAPSAVHCRRQTPGTDRNSSTRSRERRCPTARLSRRAASEASVQGAVSPPESHPPARAPFTRGTSALPAHPSRTPVTLEGAVDTGCAVAEQLGASAHAVRPLSRQGEEEVPSRYPVAPGRGTTGLHGSPRSWTSRYTAPTPRRISRRPATCAWLRSAGGEVAARGRWHPALWPNNAPTVRIAGRPGAARRVA